MFFMRLFYSFYQPLPPLPPPPCDTSRKWSYEVWFYNPIKIAIGEIVERPKIVIMQNMVSKTVRLTALESDKSFTYVLDITIGECERGGLEL